MDFLSFSKPLEMSGVGVWPNFLSADEVSLVRADIDLVQCEAGFKRAGTGQGSDNEVRNLIRRDEVHWLEKETSVQAHQAQMMLFKKIEALKLLFNRRFFLGLSQFEGHYATYPMGAFYKKHLDCFQRDDARVISLILYFNLNWLSSNGGQLRVYDKNSYTDIEPNGGTLVCFMSAEQEHEVLFSHVERVSLAGWFKR